MIIGVDMNFSKLQKSKVAWAKLNVEVPGDDIWKEFHNVKHLAKEHRSSYGSGWLSLTLHGKKPHWTEAIDRYPGYENEIDSKYPYDWTKISDECPITVEFIKSLPYTSFNRVRFMYLKAGGLIDYHRDTDKMSLSPLNISINQPDGCTFDVYDQSLGNNIKTIPFTDNSAFIVNIGHYHRVINRSDTDRLHIIVHGGFSQEFWKNTQNYITDYDTDFEVKI